MIGHPIEITLGLIYLSGMRRMYRTHWVSSWAQVSGVGWLQWLFAYSALPKKGGVYLLVGKDWVALSWELMERPWCLFVRNRNWVRSHHKRVHGIFDGSVRGHHDVCLRKDVKWLVPECKLRWCKRNFLLKIEFFSIILTIQEVWQTRLLPSG